MPARAFHDVLSAIYLEEHEELLRYARRAFPGMDPGRLEDALNDSFLEALCRQPIRRVWDERASEAAGEAGLRRVLRRVLWRQLRAQWRRKDTQSLMAEESGPDGVDLRDPERRVAAMQQLRAEETALGGEALASLFFDTLDQDERAQARVELIIAEVAGKTPWIRGALRAYVEGRGQESKTALSQRFGGHLRSARSILSRKVSQLEEALRADPLLRGHAGLA